MTSPQAKKASDREVTWIPVVKGALDEILLQKSKSVHMSYAQVNLPLDLNLVVETNNPSALMAAKKLFRFQERREGVRAIQLEGSDFSEIEKYGIIENQINSPYVGLVEEDTDSVLVLGNEGGLLKSLIVGCASQIAQTRGYYCAHASACQINGRGLMFSGGHTAGKTTALMNLLYLAGQHNEYKVLTDDWLLVNERTEQAHSLEESLSLSTGFIQQFKYLDIIESIKDAGKNDFFWDNNEGLRPLLEVLSALKTSLRKGKIFISPDSIYGVHTKIDSIPIDKVIIMEPAGRNDLIEPVGIEYAARSIVDSAYHMPDCNELNRKRHLNFWLDYLKTREVLSFDSRNSMGPQNSFIRLYNRLAGGRQ